jgi:hypothetical protein
MPSALSLAAPISPASWVPCQELGSGVQPEKRAWFGSGELTH